MTGRPLDIAFFGHDALESTIVKRVRAFAGQGCRVTGFMFIRPREGIRSRLDCAMVHLGSTRDRSYLARLPHLAVGSARACRSREALRRADVFYARNLDMLLVAAVARFCCGSAAPLVYEVLDVQRPMLRPGPVGWALRLVERRLLGRCSLLVVSSPVFVSEYFAPIQRARPDWFLLENKVSAAPDEAPRGGAPRRPGPPWVVGWFGTLRCRRSFHTLCRLADEMGPAVEIRLAGRPSPTDLSRSEIEREVARRANMTYLGGYESPRDLPALYGPTHFAWCVDYIDDGANSDWLIPNRIYEGGLHGSLALARRATATGRVVEARGLGVVLDEPIETAASEALAGVTSADYEALSRRVARMPRATFVDEADTARLAAKLCALSARPRPHGGPRPAGGDAAEAPSAPDGRFGPITRVAVVIPFFQRDPGILSRALRSIAEQRFDRPVAVEVIVVDDASPCRPEPELDGLPAAPPVRIVRRSNGGPGAARNTGLDSLAQDVDAVAFLDSDDIWLPDHLQTALDMLGTDCDVYFCDHLRPDGVSSHFERAGEHTGDLLRAAEDRHRAECAAAPPVIGRSSDRHVISGAGAMSAFIEQYWAHTSCIVYRTAAMPAHRFDAALRSAGEDYLFALQLVGAARQVCFSRRIHVERGFGVNLYDSAADWDHPAALDLVFDNFRCFLRAAGGIPARGALAPLLRRRTRVVRTKFLYVLLRRAVLMREFDLRILFRACVEDRSLVLHVPRIVFVVCLKKALGMEVPELV